MNAPVIEASIRTQTGKGYNRKLRADGKLPAVVYGDGDPIPITVDPVTLRYEVNRADGIHTKLALTLHGDQADRQVEVIIQDVERHPTRDELLHVDFMVLHQDRPLTRVVPLVLEGRPIGVRKGGKLTVFRREVRIRCLPQYFIPRLVVDINDMDDDQTLRISEVKLPEGIEVVTKDNFAIAFVKKSKAGEEEENAAAKAVAVKK